MGEKQKPTSSHYAELNRYGQNGEYERALKVANKILGVSPDEILALHCKLICLIQLSKFEEAIALLNRNPHYLKDVLFEKAYCYYRANKPAEALNILNKSEGELDLRCKELKAQILYRLEQFNEAAKMYHENIKSTNDDYEEERYTNLSAVMVYLDKNDTENKIDDLKDNTYELCYNKACILIAHENYAEAEKKLKQCEKLCREALEEDEATEEEIDTELALIRVQLAYVYQKQGRIRESHQIYTATLKLKMEDMALIAVASNNVVCINKDQNLFDSKKKMKAALNEALAYKLPSRQRKYIALNSAILNYYINQTEICEKICKNIENTYPDLMIQILILRALSLIKAEKIKEAIELLRKTEREDNKLYLHLCIAQIHLMQGERQEACKVLENLGEHSYKPGIVGALTTLYLGLGDEQMALKVFQRTVEYYKKNEISKAGLSSLWRQAAEFHIKKGLPQVAANSLEELLKTNRNDKKLIAQLVLACSQFDISRALELSKQLPDVKDIAKDVDIENLMVSTLSAPTYSKKSPAIKQDSLPSTPRDETKEKKTDKHKKRKGKLPKNYDPTVTPDPERWLPKYERTGYRKKRDRRAKEVIKGSQGTTSAQVEQFDFSKFVEENPSTSSAVDTTPKPSKTLQSQSKKGQKKGKSKRR